MVCRDGACVIQSAGVFLQNSNFARGTFCKACMCAVCLSCFAKSKSISSSAGVRRVDGPNLAVDATNVNFAAARLPRNGSFAAVRSLIHVELPPCAAIEFPGPEGQKVFRNFHSRFKPALCFASTPEEKALAAGSLITIVLALLQQVCSVFLASLCWRTGVFILCIRSYWADSGFVAQVCWILAACKATVVQGSCGRRSQGRNRLIRIVRLLRWRRWRRRWG
mmetsp:Transcript_35331/g.64135  ORF Transcript_35331/g.64135 Transcript_35331/m.64135 type:complete len:222 (-) Transcript_35331:144-809(-)